MLRRDTLRKPLLLAALLALTFLLTSRSGDPATANYGFPTFPSDAHIGYYKDGDVKKGVVFIPGTTTPLHVLFETDNRVKEMVGVPGQGLLAWRERPMGGPADIFLLNLDQQENWPPTSLRDLHGGMVQDIGSLTGCGNYLFYTGWNGTKWDLYQFLASSFDGTPGSFLYANLTQATTSPVYSPHCHNNMLTFLLGSSPGGTVARPVFAFELGSQTPPAAFPDTFTDYCGSPTAIGASFNGGYQGEVLAVCQPAPLPANVGEPADTYFKAWDFDSQVQEFNRHTGTHRIEDIRDLGGWPEHGIYTFTAPSCSGETPIPPGRDLCIFDITDPANPVPLNPPSTNVSWYYINGDSITFQNDGEGHWHRATFSGSPAVDDLLDSLAQTPGGPGSPHMEWSSYWYNGLIYESALGGLAKQ